MARVENIFVCVGSRAPLREHLEAQLRENYGLVGCRHARPGTGRQVLIMDLETLRKLELPAGAVRENLTISGLDFQALSTGQLLEIGAAVLEITGPCHPCKRMEEIRAGLQLELKGCRGWLCRVIEGGSVKCGDSLSVGVENRRQSSY